MAGMTITDSPAAPTVADPRAAARSARAAILDARPELDRLRRITPDLLERLRAAHLFRLYTPVELGGYEADPVVVAEVYEELARADGSVAWSVWNGNLGFVAAHLTDAGVRTVWANGPDPVICNSARPAGTAVPDGDGYRLSGRWNIVSAVDSADWITVFGIVLDGAGPRITPAGGPDLRAFFVRPDQVQILDSWHVGGMRGTGSNDVVIDGAFVPEELTMHPLGSAHVDRPAYRLPVFTTLASGAAATCLGIAQAAIDAVVELAPTKATMAGPGLADQAGAQAVLGRASALLEAARLGMHRRLAELWATVADGDEATPAQRGALRGAISLAAEVAREVTTSMYQLGSSAALYEGHPLERAMRDVHAAAQHVLVQPINYELAGRTLLGMDPGALVY